MGLYDRDYTQADSARQHYGLPQLRLNLPRITPVVKWLMIVNAAVFILEAVFFARNLLDQPTVLERIFAVFPVSAFATLQIWRLVTYQFLHANVTHLLMNMLSLFFFGPSLEKHWGGRRFLVFYLLCGMAGGILYTLFVMTNVIGAGTLVGASGAILGVLAACAILFPHNIILLFFVPMPIRIGAVVMVLLSVLTIFRGGPNPGGEAAHLAGLVAGASYVLLLPRWDRFKVGVRSGSWEKRVDESRKLRVEVDRILEKVHRFGLHSLTVTEKRVLKRATQEEIRRHQL